MSPEALGIRLVRPNGGFFHFLNCTCEFVIDFFVFSSLELWTAVNKQREKSKKFEIKYFNIKRSQIIRNNLKITNKNRKDVVRDRNFEKTNQDSVNGDHKRRNFTDTNPLMSSLLVIFVWGFVAIL
jgi:hypothetical protein